MKGRSKKLLRAWHRCWGIRKPTFQSFLLLFFKKELLLLLTLSSASAETLKVSTWNLNWLTARSHAEADLPTDVRVRDPADFTRLAAYARTLAADIVAFQEVDGIAAASLVFDPRQYQLVTTSQAVVQRVGLAVRHGIVIVQHSDYTALDVEPNAAHPLRDGLDATMALPDGHTLRVLVLHLKSGCQTDSLRSTSQACTLLARQVSPLSRWVAARQAEHAAFLVLGDFNRVLDDDEPFGSALAAAAPMTRATTGYADPCWDGAPFIDHIFAGGDARHWLVPGSLRVQSFRETGEEWHRVLSDHCPVSVRLDADGAAGGGPHE